MGIFKAIIHTFRSRLKGGNNFTMYSDNIGFIVKYCMKNYNHRFIEIESVLTFAGFINLQYYVLNGLLDISTIERWSKSAFASNKNTGDTIHFTVITDFIVEVQLFCFREDFEKKPYLLSQVQNQVQEHYVKTMEAVFEMMNSPCIPESEFHKHYIKEIESFLSMPDFQSVRARLNISDS